MNKTFRELEQKRNHLIDVIRASEIFDEEPSDFIKGLCGELEKIIEEINLREGELNECSQKNQFQSGTS